MKEPLTKISFLDRGEPKLLTDKYCFLGIDCAECWGSTRDVFLKHSPGFFRQDLAVNLQLVTSASLGDQGATRILPSETATRELVDTSHSAQLFTRLPGSEVGFSSSHHKHFTESSPKSLHLVS